MAKSGAGALNRRVAFDKRTDVEDDFGNTQSSFAEVFRCWAGLTFLRGGESVLAGRLSGRQPIVVRIRRMGLALQIQPDWQMRLLPDGGSYAVRSIAEVDVGSYLDVLVEAGVAS